MFGPWKLPNLLTISDTDAAVDVDPSGETLILVFDCPCGQTPSRREAPRGYCDSGLRGSRMLNLAASQWAQFQRADVGPDCLLLVQCDQREELLQGASILRTKRAVHDGLGKWGYFGMVDVLQSSLPDGVPDCQGRRSLLLVQGIVIAHRRQSGQLLDDIDEPPVGRTLAHLQLRPRLRRRVPLATHADHYLAESRGPWFRSCAKQGSDAEGTPTRWHADLSHRSRSSLQSAPCAGGDTPGASL
jgi:hypothetical protein